MLALDTSFNRSGDSAELDATAAPRTVQVTFNVTTPAVTPAGSQVYIAGSFQGWNPGATATTQVDASHWTITLSLSEGQAIEYKYTLGSWDYVEKDAACAEIANRKLTVFYGDSGLQNVEDTVANWRNVDICPN